MYTFRDRTGLSQRVIYGQDAASTGLHLPGLLYVLDPTILRAIINYILRVSSATTIHQKYLTNHHPRR